MSYLPKGLNLQIPANSDASNGVSTQNNPNLWTYNSTDTLATVQGADYFSDASDRGMALYDIVLVSTAGVLKAPAQYVSAIDPTTGAATISNAVEEVYSLTADNLTMDTSFAGKTIEIDATAGTTIILPEATGSGNVYKFLNKTLVTSNNIIIKVANSSDTIIGTTLNTPAADGAVLGFFAEGSDDTLTLNGTTKGGFGAARYTFVDFEPNRFAVQGTDCTSGSAVTPFSATV